MFWQKGAKGIHDNKQAINDSYGFRTHLSSISI